MKWMQVTSVYNWIVKDKHAKIHLPWQLRSTTRDETRMTELNGDFAELYWKTSRLVAIANIDPCKGPSPTDSCIVSPPAD